MKKLINWLLDKLERLFPDCSADAIFVSNTMTGSFVVVDFQNGKSAGA